MNLDQLSAALAATERTVQVPPVDILRRVASRRRRRHMAAATMTTLALVTGGFAVFQGHATGNRETQQLGTAEHADLTSRAQAWFGDAWTLRTHEFRPDVFALTPSTTGPAYPGNASKHGSDVVQDTFLKLPTGGAEPDPTGPSVRIQSVRYTDPTPTEDQVGEYAARGGVASHYPDDGVRASVLADRKPTTGIHVWVVQLPDKNTLVAVIWESNGRLTQIIAPGGDTPPLTANDVSALAAALVQN